MSVRKASLLAVLLMDKSLKVPVIHKHGNDFVSVMFAVTLQLDILCAICPVLIQTLTKNE